MITDTSELRTALDHGVLTLTLDRPSSLNSLTPELLDDLTQAAIAAATDDEVRCVVLTGAGRAFCSGAALGADPREFDVRGALRGHYNPAARALHELDKPVIASIRGIAAGAGAALALACDLRIAADDARLAFLFRRVGLALDAGASYHLPRIVGAGRAAELALLGDDLSAQDALAIGLVNRVVPADELELATRELAERLATGPFALTLIKRQLRSALHNTLEEQLDLEIETQGLASESEDCAEGIGSFIERRRARFTGR
jgi:2-(1,2-epoxy-1,2-dihydrophenyl)acetyl-CoA isomerase